MTERRRALEGIRICDFTGQLAGAGATNYAFGKTPWAVSRPAPTLGQHTEEVLAEAGFAAVRGTVGNG